MPESGKEMPMQRGWVYRALDVVERLGNKLPDPAILFLICFWLLGIPLGLGASYRYPAP